MLLPVHRTPTRACLEPAAGCDNSLKNLDRQMVMLQMAATASFGTHMITSLHQELTEVAAHEASATGHKDAVALDPRLRLDECGLIGLHRSGEFVLKF